MFVCLFTYFESLAAKLAGILVFSNSILFNNKAQTNRFFSGYLTSLDPNETINNIIIIINMY